MKENDANKNSSHGISIRIIGGVATIVAILLAFYAFVLASRVGQAQDAAMENERRYLECSEAIKDLQMASDYLTSQARSFVITGNRDYLDNYVNELDVANHRGKAVETLKANFSSDGEAAQELREALAASDALAQTELVAMKLAAWHYSVKDLPDEVADANVESYLREGAQKTDIAVATDLVLDDNYNNAKENIRTKVEASSDALLADLDQGVAEHESLVQNLLFQLRIVVALLLCVIMVLVLAVFMYVLKPLGNYVNRIGKSEPLVADGAYELHYLATAYNTMYEDNAKRIEQLRAFAERDPLTGISNRSGYDSFLATHTRDIVLLLIEIDNFSDFNTVYGRDTGDAVLVELSHALNDVFRQTDFPCRIENDMFAVIMTNMNTDLREVIVRKIENVQARLADDTDELPLVTLSVGAAFSTEGMSDKDIFHAADVALSDAKKSESNSIVFYGESGAAL